MQTHGARLPDDLLAHALAAAGSPVFITDRRGSIAWVNEAFCHLSGYSRAEIIGQTPSLLKSGRQDADFYHELWAAIQSGAGWSGEVVERCKDGSFVTVDEIITPLRDRAGDIAHYVVILHDVSGRKRENERDHYLAYHDPLTTLANRTLFLDSLERATTVARATDRSLALLYVDIDEFKAINDDFGHDVGDRLLTAVANRLRTSVRSTDIVSRLGGDEFCVLQTVRADALTASAAAKKLVHDLSQLFVLDGHRIRTSISVGIALYPRDGESATALMQNADRAMYGAKRHGRNRYGFFGTAGQENRSGTDQIVFENRDERLGRK